MPRVRFGNEEVEAFVQQLREFHGVLPPARRTMLESILDAAQGSDTSGYGRRFYGYEDWESLTNWLGQAEDTEGYGKRSPALPEDEQEAEDTSGYGRRAPRHEDITAG